MRGLPGRVGFPGDEGSGGLVIQADDGDENLASGVAAQALHCADDLHEGACGEGIAEGGFWEDGGEGAVGGFHGGAFGAVDEGAVGAADDAGGFEDRIQLPKGLGETCGGFGLAEEGDAIGDGFKAVLAVAAEDDGGCAFRDEGAGS